MSTAPEITRLLQQAEQGSSAARDELMRAVYADLERMAGRHLKRHFGAGAAAVTLEPSALVNESFMKLIRQRNTYDNRGQFFAIATRLMLRVLIDYRRQRDAVKRGRSRILLPIDEQRIEGGAQRASTIEVEELEAALEKLQELDPRKADVVKMRIVWGLDNATIADSLGVSRATVERDWSFAQVWLADEVDPGD